MRATENERLPKTIELVLYAPAVAGHGLKSQVAEETVGYLFSYRLPERQVRVQPHANPRRYISHRSALDLTGVRASLNSRELSLHNGVFRSFAYESAITAI